MTTALSVQASLGATGLDEVHLIFTGGYKQVIEENSKFGSNLLNTVYYVCIKNSANRYNHYIPPKSAILVLTSNYRAYFCMIFYEIFHPKF